MYSMYSKLLLLLLTTLPNLHSKSIDQWSPSISYLEVVELAKGGSSYFQGLLGVFLRSGEFGSSVNINLAKQWSEVSYRNSHPFGSYNLANIAMLEGDFAKATQHYQDAALLLQRKASDGDPVSMYCMGEIDFQVIPTNVPRALEWFKKSSDLGYPQAQATLGALYLKGLPGLLPKNTKEGISLLSKAVRKKSLTARFNLGMAYLNGDGVKTDAGKAVQWLRVAESQNFAEAQYTLGLLLLEGKDGVEKNTVEGLTFLEKASAQNHQLATRYLEKYQGLESTVSSSPLAENFSANDQERLENAKKAYTGVGSSKNYDKAFALFYPLAKSGNAEAARFVGLMKFSGKGTNKNIKEARQWLSVASQKGDMSAKQLLEKYKSLFQ